MIEDKALIFSLAGLAFAALLSSAGYFWRGRVASKRSAKKVLYLLLEIRHALGTCFFDSGKAKDQYIQYYTDRLNNKGVQVAKASLDAEMGAMIEGHFSNVIQASKSDIEGRLLHPFEEALSVMAQDFPVLAYQLRGKEKLDMLAKVNSDYFDTAIRGLDDAVDQDWAKNEILNFYDDMKTESLSRMLDDLDDDITELSRRCGWLESRECKKRIKVKPFNDYDAIFSDLDDIIDGFIERMNRVAMEELEKKNQQAE